MRNIVLQILILMQIPALAMGACTSATPTAAKPVCISVPSAGDTFPKNVASVDLQAYLYTAGGYNEVTYYYDTALSGGNLANPKYIGTAFSAPWDVTWNNPPNGANIYLQAEPGIVSTANIPTSNNGWIDKVENPDFPYQASLSNPALDPNFGEPASSCPSGNCTWIAGDNQMCSGGTWAYNGKGPSFPDGECEWTGDTTTLPAHIASPGGVPQIQTGSSVDSLDDVMHTLSDFDKFAKSIIVQDPGSLTSTFDSWYPQAAAWIAPQCACATHDSTCNAECNPGSPGRLLSIYAPVGFPGIPGVAPYPGPTVDVLGTWNQQITKWLDTSFTPSGSTSYVATSGANAVWCVPSSGISGTTEANYIYDNATSPTWGDLQHVVACLNFNAGPTSSEVNFPLFQQCLNDLTSVATCSLPSSCQASSLNLASAPAFDTTTGCKVYKANGCAGGSCNNGFAYWVSSHLNFGPIYNYQTCLDFLTKGGTCPASISGTVCDSSILGRWLTKDGSPGFSSTHGCDPTYTNVSSGVISFAQWVNNNLSLFQDENPKFVKRYKFLNDIYTRAKTLQSLTTQADSALHDFFKACDKCADGTACPVSGKCAADDSKCGSAKCADGGPAAQLIYARAHPIPVSALPNSVIYGWVDKSLANGKSLLTGTAGAGGYAHAVKVTAFAPGRNGGAPSTNNAPNIETRLPWIRSWTTFFYQYYTLTNRDGNVYISVQRWDQDHGDTVQFPNKHTLWQFMFQNPAKPNVNGTNSPMGNCRSDYSNAGLFSPLPQSLGFGLKYQTVQGLMFPDPATGVHQVSTDDINYLRNAFMLNDDGQGGVDPEARLATDVCDPTVPGSCSPTCSTDSSGAYCGCVGVVNTLLASGIESHACVRYVASLNGNSPNSGTGDNDYRMYFIDCRDIENGGVPPSSLP